MEKPIPKKHTLGIQCVNYVVVPTKDDHDACGVLVCEDDYHIQTRKGKAL